MLQHSEQHPGCRCDCHECFSLLGCVILAFKVGLCLLCAAGELEGDPYMQLVPDTALVTASEQQQGGFRRRMLPARASRPKCFSNGTNTNNTNNTSAVQQGHTSTTGGAPSGGDGAPSGDPGWGITAAGAAALASALTCGGSSCEIQIEMMKHFMLPEELAAEFQSAEMAALFVVNPASPATRSTMAKDITHSGWQGHCQHPDCPNPDTCLGTRLNRYRASGEAGKSEPHLFVMVCSHSKTAVTNKAGNTNPLYEVQGKLARCNLSRLVSELQSHIINYCILAMCSHVHTCAPAPHTWPSRARTSANGMAPITQQSSTCP